MSNPILTNKKLIMKRDALQPIEDKLQALLAKRNELDTAIEAAQTEEELQQLEQNITENESEITTTEEEKSTLEQEIQGLEEELERSKKNVPQNQNRSKKGSGKMENQVEVREALNEYVRSKGNVQQRAGFTTVEGGALVPVELLAPQVTPTGVTALKNLINVVPVNSGGGKYPVIKKSGSKMNSVAELVANPELAKPTITSVNYSIVTYRGYIPVSQELIDDADYDVTGLISAEIQEQALATENHAIATVLKSATAKSVVGLDGLKDLFNKDLKRIYADNAVAIITASLYAALDKIKDENGRYLLQDNITSPSGKSLFGKQLIVLDDTVIGAAANDLKGFVGDAKSFATFFDRKQASVKWTDDSVYGELLASFIRFDVEKVDAAAGFYITYTAPAPAV